MKVLVFAIAMGLIVSVSPAPAANAITNGSFETPLVPPGSFTDFASGSSLITGWTVVGPEVAVVSGSFAQNGVSFGAQDLNQWVDLTGFNANSVEGLSQSVATTPGHEYQLSYFIGNTTGGGIFGTSSTVNVQINGAQTFSDVNSTVSPTSLNWQQFMHTFIAAGASTTLSFLNGDPASDNSNGLDNVALVDLGAVVSAVPEPSTYLMMLAGLASIMLLIARRRKPISM
jgi:hypothetical protein